MRIALLSNFTVDMLANMLKKNFEVYLPSGFNTWQQEILLPESGLYSFKPETIVVMLYADAYSEIWNDSKKGEQLIEEWCNAIEVLSDYIPRIPIFVSSIDISNEKCFYGSENRLGLYLEYSFYSRIQKMHERGMNIYVLPIKDKIADIGRKNFYSPKMWYLGSVPYSMKGMSVINDVILNYIGAVKGIRKKCIVVDLDNTLWGGIIGEDGTKGIILSNDGEGVRFKDTQRLLKKMKEKGVMLAVISKNNYEDVEPVYELPDMILQHEDFVAEIINWEPKYINIRQLAETLNIGLDSFVFLDDNPAEREQMKEECPEVTILDFPKDTSLLPAVIATAYEEYFFSLEVTEEDLKKTDMYRAEKQRNEVKCLSSSVESYLNKLEMVMDIHYLSDDEITRVAQLMRKTNQFNLTTKRYSEEEILSLALSENNAVITVHMSDKFGNQGLVAVVILRFIGEKAEIDSFLMSCRVMGRNAEIEIMYQIKKMLQKRNEKTISARFIKTSRNSPVSELYEMLGFEIAHCKEDEKDYKANIDDLPECSGVFKEVNSNL